MRLLAPLCALAGLLAACASGAETANVPVPAPAQTAALPARMAVQFTELAPGVWMHTSYKVLENWGPVPTNGLILLQDNREALLIDTAWDNAQTEDILDWTATTLGYRITTAILTHAHDDKMGGVGRLRTAGVLTFANAQSNAAAPARGLVPAEVSLRFSAEGEVEPLSARHLPGGVSVFYPGPAHTGDNIVVGLDESGILFGGCMIRPGFSSNLGNTADGDVARWEASTLAVAARFPEAGVIVPSHGPPGPRDLLDQTAALARSAAARQ